MNKIIEELVSKIKNRYQDLYVGSEYNKAEDHYEIWYNDDTLDSDESFQLFIGELIYDYLLSKEIFNVSFFYNYEKSKFIENETLSNVRESSFFSIKKSLFMKASNYQTNIDRLIDKDDFICLAA